MNDKFFNSKYPILEAAMNRGADVNLALACWEAGIFPSLVVPLNHPDNMEEYYSDIDSQLTEFKKSTGTIDLNVAIDITSFADSTILKILSSHKVTHLEIYPQPVLCEYFWYAKDKPTFNAMVNSGRKFLEKSIGPLKIIKRTKVVNVCEFGFGYTLKGSDAAGVTSSTYTTAEMFKLQKDLTPDAIIIPYGGVGTPKQVADYISAGATAVGVGTLLAASVESNLSMDTKLALVGAKTENLVKLPDTGQQSLLFEAEGQILNKKQNKHDWNREQSLEQGLRGNAHEGHIYAGTAVDYITEIRPVKEIVEYLVSELQIK